MASLTRWVLSHKRTVVVGWVLLTIAGIMASGPATDALDPEFSVPNKEGWETNVEIAKRYQGTGGDTVPLVPVVTLPAGKTVDSPGVRTDLAQVDKRLSEKLPRSRLASYASTGDRAFVSDDGRTTFAFVYPQPDPDSTFGENPRAEKSASAALRDATVAGAPVHLTGFDALMEDSGAGNDGPGVLIEAVIGGIGALVVLTFVFASFLAVIPIVMAIVSIMTTFLLLLGLTALTSVSPIVQFLIALIGLGVAIDYSLIVASRWREERSARCERRRGRAARDGDRRPGRRLQRHHGRDRPVRADRAAPPLPALDGLRGSADPAGVDCWSRSRCCRWCWRSSGSRLDWPHRRTDDKASRAWTRWAQGVANRRWLAAGAGLAVILALVVAATDLQMGSSDANTVAKSGDAKDGLTALEKSGIGEGSILPHEILVKGDTDPQKVAAGLRAGRRHPRCRGAGQPRLAARRNRAGGGDPDPRQRNQ